jgi:hypothetical protein
MKKLRNILEARSDIEDINLDQHFIQNSIWYYNIYDDFKHIHQRIFEI